MKKKLKLAELLVLHFLWTFSAISSRSAQKFFGSAYFWKQHVSLRSNILIATSFHSKQTHLHFSKSKSPSKLDMYEYGIYHSVISLIMFWCYMTHSIDCTAVPTLRQGLLRNVQNTWVAQTWTFFEISASYNNKQIIRHDSEIAKSKC